MLAALPASALLAPDIAARINALKAGEVDGAAVQPATAAEVEASGATLNTGVANWAGLHILALITGGEL